ncbi:MAG: hypothetical protein H7256_04075 [Bdellovibrio sp.]|nr:hypothetical protein [Bdellovibrio sp.]
MPIVNDRFKIILFFLFYALSLSAADLSSSTKFGDGNVSLKNDMAVKIKLARLLISAEQIDTKIKEGVQYSGCILQPQKIKIDSKFNKQMYLDSKTKYDQIKLQLQNESIDSMSELFAKKFSAAEINYLIQLSNNSLNRKFQLFKTSSDYNAILEIPYKKASSLLDDSFNKSLR